jgi:hypothetical protein
LLENGLEQTSPKVSGESFGFTTAIEVLVTDRRLSRCITRPGHILKRHIHDISDAGSDDDRMIVPGQPPTLSPDSHTHFIFTFAASAKSLSGTRSGHHNSRTSSFTFSRLHLYDPLFYIKRLLFSYTSSRLCLLIRLIDSHSHSSVVSFTFLFHGLSLAVYWLFTSHVCIVCLIYDEIEHNCALASERI